MPYTKNRDFKGIIFFLILFATCLVTAQLIAFGSNTIALAIIVAIVVCVVTFLKPEYSLYLLVFSMLLSPEFGQRSTEGAGVTLRVDDFLIALIGLSWIARTALVKELGIFRKTVLNKPIFIYLFACVVATGLGVLMGNVKLKSGFFFVLKYFEYYVVYFMVVNHIKNRKQIQVLIVCMLITCVIVDIVAIAQIPGGKRLSAPFEGEMGEPNTLGGYLVLMITLSIALWASIKSRKVKFLLLIVIGFSIVPFLFSLSRGSYLAMIPAYFALIALSKKRGLLIMALMLIIAVGPFVIPKKVVNRVMHTFSQRQQQGQTQVGKVKVDTSTSIRLRSWSRGFKATMERPIFGFGVTGWYFIDNQFTKVLVETGFFGLCAFLYLLFSIFKEGLKVLRLSDDNFFNGITIGFLAGLVGIIVHSIGANSFIIVRIMEPFWLLAGIVMMIPAVLASEHERDKEWQKMDSTTRYV